MDALTVKEMAQDFDQYVFVTDDETEFWYARDLQTVLGYTKWENFKKVIDKAIESCETAGFQPSDHFLDVGKMIDTAKGAQRKIKDYMLTRYACYLIAQNGDPAKEEIAFAQAYFAVQTRKQELIEERLSEIERLKSRKKLSETEKVFSEVLYIHGVDDQGFARVRSRGDAALFGGYSTKDMKRRMGTPEKKPLADFLPSITITAKQLATEITTHNITKENLQGENPITDEHVTNNKAVRNILVERGIKPEELPAEADIKKIERKVQSSEKKLAKGSKKKIGSPDKK
jgi:DNA-damage-inducible protein D